MKIEKKEKIKTKDRKTNKNYLEMIYIKRKY